MRIAVVTPYHEESLAVLRRCHDSVARQNGSVAHLMVADGCQRQEINSWAVQHIILPRSHGAGGDLPRCIGSICAIRQGFDAVAYLDADNWFYPNHLAIMTEVHKSSTAAVCIARRSLHRADGSSMPRTEPLLAHFFDTNCMYLTRRAFGLVPIWGMMPPELSGVGDRVMSLAFRKHGLSIAVSDKATVAYTTQWREDYERIGEAPPVNAKSSQLVLKAIAFWKQLSTSEKRRILGLPDSLSEK